MERPGGRAAGIDAAWTLATGDDDAISRVMVCSGRPVREPVAMAGPFVMNTRAEVERAYGDFHAGHVRARCPARRA